MASLIDLDTIAAGTGGFKIQGQGGGDQAGVSVSSAGDLNGDGFGDIVIGANYNDSDPDGNNAGAAYVVFGFAIGPEAQDDTLSAVAEDSGTRTIAFATLTGNDNDADLDPLTVTAVGSAVGGSVSIDGSDVLFTPTRNFNGVASFTYTVGDGDGGTDTATVSFDVTPVNDEPLVPNRRDTDIDEDAGARRYAISSLLNGVIDADGDTLVLQSVGGAVGGSVAISGSDVVFTPTANFNGKAKFEFTVSDGHGGADTATASFQVVDLPQPNLFTAGDDAVDLNAFDLSLYPGTQATRALAGKDVVQLSHTQKLGVVFEAGAGNDTITGSSSADRIHGDGGRDSLLGQNGDDTLTGGAGNDSFLFDDAGTEAVTDFAFGVTAGNKDVIDLRALDLADWTGSDSQISVTGSGSSRTIHVDLNNDHNAANNTTQAEVIIQVNAGLGGLVRNFVISDTNPLADILV